MTDPISRLNAALEGRYAIERELGEGGRATVYLADDIKHNRKVALKVLKPDLAAVVGAERFVAEIKVTANLQHPHILPLFDSGEADRFLFYVMPYVEGESLRQKLDREGQLPVDEAVRIASDVAEALSHAHERGVIHRDIKPGNILLRDGRPLVADFGIALAIQHAGGGRLTETGLSLGTPYYMSPEQATADRDPDARSDLYSLACVLYEMLVGEPPYTGASAQAVLGKIITADAPLVTQQRKGVPPHVEAAISWALEKLPADRVPSGAKLAEILSDRGAIPSSRMSEASTRDPLIWRERLVWAVALAAVLVLSTFRRGRTNDDAGVRRLSVTLPDSAPMAFIGAAVQGNGRRAFAVSDDGSTLVYVGVRDGVARLYVRPIASFDARELPGTEGAFGPFLSPNGLWIAYFVGNQLRKIRVDGGAPITVAQAPNSNGGDWAEDGTIVFATNEGIRLERVLDQGGATERLGIPGAWDRYQWPQVVPGTSEVLLSGPRTMLWALDVETGAAYEIGEPVGEARYLPSGHIVLVRGSVMYVARFDVASRAFTSPTVPVLSGLRGEIYGQGQWDVTADGTLVFASGTAVAENALTWVSPDGTREPLAFPTRFRGTFELSPSGDRIAVEEESAGQKHVWVYDLATGRRQQMAQEGNGTGPLGWSPDGREILLHRTVFSLRNPSMTPHAQRADGGSSRPLLDALDSGNAYVSSWSAIGLLGVGLGTGVAVVDPESDDVTPIPLTDSTSWGLVISPRGDAVAYTSQHTGAHHTYVQPFPPTGDVQQVSVAGGAEEPRWSPSGDRLFYRNGQRIMVAAVETGPPLSVATPEVFYSGAFVNVSGRSYDISSDGQRALVMDGGVVTTTTLNVVQGWLADVERLIAEAEGADSGGGS